MNVRDVLTSVLEVVGVLAMVTGVFLLWGGAVACIVAGVCAVGAGYLLGGER